MLLMLYEGIVMTRNQSKVVNQFLESEIFNKLSDYIADTEQAKHRVLAGNIRYVLRNYDNCLATGDKYIAMICRLTTLKDRLFSWARSALIFNKKHLIICAAEDKNIYKICSTPAMMEHWDQALSCENSVEGISSLDTLINRMYHAEHIRFKDSHQPVLQQRSEDCLELAKQFGYTQPLEEKENTLPIVGRAYN